MKKLLIFFSVCLLVGCGNDYGIKKGNRVKVFLKTGDYAFGYLKKVTSEMIVIVDKYGNKGDDSTSIPRSNVSHIMSWPLD